MRLAMCFVVWCLHIPCGAPLRQSLRPQARRPFRQSARGALFAAAGGTGGGGGGGGTARRVDAAEEAGRRATSSAQPSRRPSSGSSPPSAPRRKRLWSPSDLMLYMQSPFAAWMERLYRDHPEHPWLALTDPADMTANPMMAMLSEKGQAAERRFLENEFLSDRQRYRVVADLSNERLYGNTPGSKTRSAANAAAAATVAAMRDGADVIFQAPLAGAGGFGGVADFLVKKPWVVTAPDSDGATMTSTTAAAAEGDRYDYYYEVWDAKFGKRAAPQHMLQLWCYTEMVHDLWNGPRCFGQQQATTPELGLAEVGPLPSGDSSFAASSSSSSSSSSLLLPPPPLRACLVLDAATVTTPFALSPFGAYYRQLKRRFLAFHADFDLDSPPPLPLSGQFAGRWEPLAKQLLEDRDDLTLVARLTRRQAERLRSVRLPDGGGATKESAGNSGGGGKRAITSLSSLAALPLEEVPLVAEAAGMDAEVLGRLRRQAKLQAETRTKQRAQQQQQQQQQQEASGGKGIMQQRPAWELLDGRRSARLLVARLPGHCQGDVFFDLEGHPFADDFGGDFGGGAGSGSGKNVVVSGNGIASREYLWGATIYDTEIDQSSRTAAAIRAAAGEQASPSSSSSSSSCEFQSMPHKVNAYREPSQHLRYVAWWAHSARAELDAFTAFADWLTVRLAQWPALKVYHYGAYEVTALKRLAARCGLQQQQQQQQQQQEEGSSGGFTTTSTTTTNYERVVDDWLRRGVFVDLYPLVRRCLLVGEPKYSIKNLEKLYDDWDDEAPLPLEDAERLGDHHQQEQQQQGQQQEPRVRLRSGAAVAKGDDSVVAYQRWLERPDAAGAGAGSKQLEAIRAYNQGDTDSTHRAVKWLRAVAASASRAYGFEGGNGGVGTGDEEGEDDEEVDAARAEKDAEEREAKAAEEGELDDLTATLLDDDDSRWTLSPSFSSPSSELVSRRAREVAAAALEFERREAKPGWWRRFAWLDATDRELLGDEGVLGGLVHDPSVPPVKRTKRKKKFCYEYRFDPTRAKGSKLAQALAAALEEKAAVGGSEDPRAASVLGVPSEQDCSPLDAQEGALYDRQSPLRAAVVEIDLQLGIAVLEMGLPDGGDSPPCGVNLLPDEFVNPEPIPGAVKRTVKEWVSDPAAAAAGDPVFALLAGTPPLLHFEGEDAADGAPAVGSGVIDRAMQHLSRVRERSGDGEEDADEETQEASVLEAAAAAAAALRRSSYLAIQGPPGTGKTTAAAIIVADAVGRGQRVAVTANSHRVISNLLAKATELLAERGARGDLDGCGALQERLRGGGGVARPIGVVKIGGSSAACFAEDVQSIEGAAERGNEAGKGAGGGGSGLGCCIDVRGAKGAKGAELEANDLLIGATGWGLANEALEGCAEYLVVDEAGQVPVTRLLAMKRVLANQANHENEEEEARGEPQEEQCSGGLILLGDQMQLPAPMEGTHPGQSGKSILEYLLLSSSSPTASSSSSSSSSSTSTSSSGGGAVVPPDMGIFLPVSYRLHPELCDVVSALVYDGELRAHPSNACRTLQLLPTSEQQQPTAQGLKEGLKETPRGSGSRLLDRSAGLVVVPVAHSGNTQASAEEAAVVVDIVRELLDPSRTRLQGETGQGRDSSSGDALGRPLTMDDLLFVSPFNLQVQRLSSALRGANLEPPGKRAAAGAHAAAVRVGTVDRFQGQEAPVVIISLARSSFGQSEEESGEGGGSGAEGDSEGDLDEAAAASGEGVSWRAQTGAFLDVDVMDDQAGGTANAGGAAGGGAAAAAAAELSSSSGGSSSSSSSGAVSFVLDVRRLNVALSRAQCLAIVVMSPQLAAASAASLDQMRALSFACRLLEGNDNEEKGEGEGEPGSCGRGSAATS